MGYVFKGDSFTHGPFAGLETTQSDVEGYVEGSGGSAMHTALNTLHAATVAAIIGLIPTVTVIEDIQEGDLRTAVAPLASAARLAFSQDFTITFATRRGQP